MLLVILYIIGIIADGITGALAAGKRQMDLFGVMFIACATAIGGGSVRDILFGHYPLTWVQHPEYLLVVCIAAFITTRIPYVFQRLERTFLILDALGLSVFSVIGAKIGMMYHDTGSIAVIGAVITGVFGGILRDIFCARVPLVFQKDLYASVSLVVGIIYVAMHFISLHIVEINETITALICITIGFVMRVVAIRYQLSLPTFSFMVETESNNVQKKKDIKVTTKNTVRDSSKKKKLKVKFRGIDTREGLVDDDILLSLRDINNKK